MQYGFCKLIMPKMRFFRYDGNPDHIPAWVHDVVSEMNSGDGTHPYDEVWDIDVCPDGICATQTRYDKALRRHWGGCSPTAHVGDYIVERDFYNHPFLICTPEEFAERYVITEA